MLPARGESKHQVGERQVACSAPMVTMQSMMSETVAQLFAAAEQGPLLPQDARPDEMIFDRQVLERLVPHDPLLLLDCITHVDLDRDIAGARCTPLGSSDDPPLCAHQQLVAAIAQLGRILLCLHDGRPAASPSFSFPAHPAVARFPYPATEGIAVDAVVSLVAEGQASSIVGQCLQGDRVCGVAVFPVECLSPA